MGSTHEPYWKQLTAFKNWVQLYLENPMLNIAEGGEHTLEVG